MRNEAAGVRGAARPMRPTMSAVDAVHNERRAQRVRGPRRAGSAPRRLTEHAGLAGSLAALKVARACRRGVGPLGTVQQAGWERRRRAGDAHVERGDHRGGRAVHGYK